MPFQPNPAPSNNTNGFTLLEILIAMAVLAIMSVMAYSGLRTVLEARVATERRSEQLAGLQTLLFMMNEDLTQAAARSVRDEYGLSEPAMRSGTAGDLLTLTRSTPAWSARQLNRPLLRIRYRFDHGVLYRQTWTTLDRTQQSEYQNRKLAQLQHISLRFFDNDWTENWTSERAPKAVEVTATVAGFGEIKRIFFIHD